MHPDCEPTIGVGIGDIEQFLQECIAKLAPMEERAGGPGRPRILPAMCLWAGLLVCVLRGFSSQLALWRLLSREGLWYYPRFPVSDEAIYKRLATDTSQSMAWLFAQITDLLVERLEPLMERRLAPFATDIVAIDETTLDPVQKKLPPLRALPTGDRQLLPGKLAGLFDVRRQVWRTVEYVAEATQNEKVLARDLVARVAPGSLLLMDLGYFSFAFFDDLTDDGYFWISRLRNKTSYTVCHTYIQQHELFDGLIWLGKHRADRAKHAVRLVRVRHQGRTYEYITNVRDPGQLPAGDLVQLYGRRWDIEMAVQLVKQHLRLGMLWSAKPAVILQQVWAVLIIAQVLQALRFEVAQRLACDPFEVSMPLLVEYVPRWAAAGKDPLQMLVEHGRAMRLIRPSRRTVYQVPTVALDAVEPVPPDLVLTREPRYAQRKCGRGEN
jgi:hypothetical protein